MFSGSDFHTFFVAGVGCAGFPFQSLTRWDQDRWIGAYVILVFHDLDRWEAFDEVWCMYCNHKTLRNMS